MTHSFVMCARAVQDGVFISEPGITQFLLVPEGQLPLPKHAIKNKEAWFKKLRSAAMCDTSNAKGDVLIFIHGYNNDQETVMQRHTQLKQDLLSVGFNGEVMSFDWPSNDKALNYLEDRHDAKKVAMQLVSDGISLLSEKQTSDCPINIHVLGHSTGAYVIREAFDDADDTNLANSSWMVSQIIFIGGDISSSSMSHANSSSESLYRHCTRVTNYSNLYDHVLKLSSMKRLGSSPRIGRVGLPPDIPSKVVNIDCSDYFNLLDSNEEIKNFDQNNQIGTFVHSWHIGNKIFTLDLLETIKGDIDRTVISTRIIGQDGKLKLIRPVDSNVHHPTQQIRQGNG